MGGVYSGRYGAGEPRDHHIWTAWSHIRAVRKQYSVDGLNPDQKVLRAY